MRILVRRPGAAVALATLVLMLLSAILAPLLARYSPNAIDPVAQFQGPNADHWFGTDELGRDLFARVLHGGRLAFVVTFGATVVALVLGTLWGAVAASTKGLWDEVLMRVADTLMAIPAIMLALIFIAAFGASTLSLVIILGALFVPGTARIVRAAVSSELEQDYRLAAVAYGASTRRILFSEVLPNTTPTLLAQASLTAAGILMTEASLSFVGLGVQPPDASWGTLLQDGYSKLYQSYWYIAFPGAAIIVSILALNTLGDHIQAILDPHASRGDDS